MFRSRMGVVSLASLLSAATLIGACSSRDITDTTPTFDYAPSTGDGLVCIPGGDPGPATWDLQACETETGFLGQEFLTALGATTAVDPASSVPLPRYVYFVHEIWWASSGAAGAAYRLDTATFYGGSIGTVVNVEWITGSLMPELEAVSFQGFVGACPADSAHSTPRACAEYAFATTSYHDEPALCVWNEAYGAGRDRPGLLRQWTIQRRGHPATGPGNHRDFWNQVLPVLWEPSPHRSPAVLLLCVRSARVIRSRA